MSPTPSHSDFYLASATSIGLLRLGALRRLKSDGAPTTIHHHTADEPCEDREHETFGAENA